MNPNLTLLSRCAAPLLAIGCAFLFRMTIAQSGHGLSLWDALFVSGVLAVIIGLALLKRWGWILAHVAAGLMVPLLVLGWSSFTGLSGTLAALAIVALIGFLNAPPVRALFAMGGAFRFLLGIAISDVFIVLILKDMNVGDVVRDMAGIGWGALWLIPAIVIYIAAIWVRTSRWRFLLNPVKRCTTTRLFPIYIISYMANNILPLRMGDIYRAYIVGKKESVSKAAALTTVAVERVFDGLTMLLFLVITSFFFPFPAQIQQALRIGGFVFLGVLALCYIMLWQQKLAQHIISSLLSFLPPGLQNKLQTLVESIFTGMSVLRGAKDMVAVNGLSIVTWVMEAVMYHFVLLAFDIPQPFYVSLTLLAVVNLFIIVPGPPGYFGPFEFACKIVLTVSSIGVSEQRAIAYALILHVVGQWLPSTLLGLYYMWREHISFHEVEDRPQPSR